MSKFTRTIAAGGGIQVDVSGTGLIVKTSTGVITVLPDNRNASREMISGDVWRFSDYKADPTFKNLHIRNKTVASITFTIEVHEVSQDIFESQGTSVTQDASSDPWATREKPSGSNVDGGAVVGVASAVLVAASALNVGTISIQPQGGDIYIAKGAAATLDYNSFKIKDGLLYECKTTEAIYAIAAANVNTWWEAQRV